MNYVSITPKVIVFILALTLVGCAGTGVIQIAPDTYMITETDGAGIFGSPGALKARVIRKASEFAASQGKYAIPITTNETPKGPGRFASIEYQFRVVDKDDPEYRRVHLKQRADLVIEDNKSIDIEIEDKRAPEGKETDLYEQLLRLDDLKQRGILSDEEFEAQKQKLLQN